MNTKDSPVWVGCLKQSEILSHLRSNMKDTSIEFTFRELETLHDSVFMEMGFFENIRQSDCVKYKMLQALHQKLNTYLYSEK